MAKKNNGIKYIIYLISLGIFGYYEYGLYQKYSQEKNIRDKIREEKTNEIKRAFLLRKEDFYLDRDYEKKLENLKKQELLEENSLEEGGNNEYSSNN